MDTCKLTFSIAHMHICKTTFLISVNIVSSKPNSIHDALADQEEGDSKLVIYNCIK